MWYNFDVNAFISNYVWKTARKSKFLDYCQCLMRPIKTLHSQYFPDFYDDQSDRALWNGQVLVLEDILNETYGYSFSTTATNSIYITDSDVGIEQYFYNEDEFSGDRPIYFFNEAEQIPLYMYNTSEGSVDFDFNVYLPFGDDDQQLKTIVNELKIANTKYRVIRY